MGQCCESEPGSLEQQGNSANIDADSRLRLMSGLRAAVLLFSRNGERYVMSQVEHRGTFPLLDTLQASAPTKVNQVFSWYDRKTAPGIDREKLGYFASSVLWRASAHDWKGAKTDVRLGPYEERFRQYLLEQSSFPRDVVLMVVACTDAVAQNTFYLPSLGLKTDITIYTVQMRGLNFMMMLGKNMTDAMQFLCCVTGSDGWIVSRSCQDKIVETAQRIAEGRTA